MQLRLNAQEREAFDRLVVALAEEMPGVEMTDAGAVRAVVVAAMAARGIEWPRPSQGSPRRRTTKPTGAKQARKSAS